MTVQDTNQTILELRAVSKCFGGVAALRGANLSVRRGEIHGLLGASGAGKSTLIDIVTGVVRPDAGAICFEGRAVKPCNPRRAAALGIAATSQTPLVFPQLSLAENVLIGHGFARNRAGFIDWPATYASARQLLGAFDGTSALHAAAGGLSLRRRVIISVAAALARQPSLLLLDEPTAALTQEEAGNLFRLLGEHRHQGMTILYASGHPEEIAALCDRATVMRDGETLTAAPAGDVLRDASRMMITGGAAQTLNTRQSAALGDVRLRVEHLSDAEERFLNISLDIRAGEVLGLYGRPDAGQSEVGQALFALRGAIGGRMWLDGRKAAPATPRQAVDAGIAYLPGGRLTQGVFPNHSVRTNVSVTMLPRLARAAGYVRDADERAYALDAMAAIRIPEDLMEQPMNALDAGHRGKALFARWEGAEPRVIILDEPTRGVGLDAKAEIHGQISKMAQQGAAILLSSSDLHEIMALSNRVLTICEGRVAGEFNPEACSHEAVAAAATPHSAPVRARRAIEKKASRGGASHVRETGLLFLIGLVAVIMAVAGPAEFATWDNLWTILAAAAIPAIVAQGVMLVIGAGSIDISVGSMLGLAAAISSLLALAGAPLLLCIAGAIALGAGAGALNGAATLAGRIHPIIVTLAALSIYRAITETLVGAESITALPHGYRVLAEGGLLAIPKVFYYAVAVAVATHVFLQCTVAGRRTLAVGDSSEAARRAGVSNARYTLLAFAVSGLLVGFAAVLYAGFNGTAPGRAGAGLELQAIAAALIGGASIRGGRGAALGTLLGAVLVAIAGNILLILDAAAHWRSITVGGLIMLAVAANVSLQRLRGRL